MGQTLLGGPGTAGRHRAARTHGHDAYLLHKAVGSMIEGAANSEALFEEKERAQITLNSIGDAVMSTDVSGRVTYLNAIAEGLTGWLQEEAVGHPLEDVFRIVVEIGRASCRERVYIS